MRARKCKERIVVVCLEIGPGQECVRDCCSVYLPCLGDTGDTDISQQPPRSPEPPLIFREPISTHTHTHAHTIKHYLYVFPLSRPGNRLCVSLSRPGLSEPYDPGRAAQTVLLLFNYTTSVTRFLVITVRFSCLTRNYYLHMSLI